LVCFLQKKNGVSLSRLNIISSRNKKIDNEPSIAILEM
jgi:hypothetical protein